MPGALADAVAGRNVVPSFSSDLVARFNSNDAVGWYYGTDGNTPSGRNDFVTLVLHEIGHGLGFISASGVSETTDGVMEGRLKIGQGNLNYIYDTFVLNGSGTAITTFEDPSAALFSQLTGNNLFWDGEKGKAENGGNRPKLYAPTTWDPGGSFIHLDESTFPAGNQNSLMTPLFSRAEAIHHPGSIGLGMFEDMGWTIRKAPVFVVKTVTRSDVGDVTPLSTMTHLRYPHLSGNDNLTNIKHLVKLRDAGTSIDITLPRPVNIPDENLEDELQTALGFQTDESIFPEDMETLITFNASNRSISTLTGLEKAINLTTLHLSNNTISSISPLSRLTKLALLNLSENTI